MTFGSMVALWLSGLLVAPPAATSDPVPVQRPNVAPPPSAAPPEPIAPIEPIAPEPIAPEPIAPEPIAPVEAPVDAAPTDAPAEPPAESVVTTEASAESAPAVVISDEDLDEVTEEEVAAATPIDADRREAQIRSAQTMIAAGSIFAIGGFVMAVAAGVEGAKPDCKFGLDDCSNAPRPKVTTGLAIGATIGLAAGAALLGVGIYKLRKVRASVAVDGRTAGLVISGRF
jgi:hypothetical protein